MSSTVQINRKRRGRAAEPVAEHRRTKFMQTLSVPVYKALLSIAKKKGVSLQELLRAEIIPEWLKENRQR
ncbi:MAG TPA: hypothetical protein VFE98_08815 [Candidatus Bathyarchaeia archaeon]|nr:hypothetical protein [Candidatus Bathyarchaeia archaeon]